MSADDEREFTAAFAGEADALKKESDIQWWFHVGDCRIQFLPSRRTRDQIALGRIALATHGSGESFSAAPQAEALFKRMRAWLKKRYSNRLIVENASIPGSATAYRTFWLGPDAREQSRVGHVTLRSFLSLPVIFKEEKPNKAPEPTTMAVTSRAPSSTSRARHGRGSS